MAEERQTNYTVAEGYELPSKGKIYSVPVNPHVELRSMTARDEMKRLSPSTTPLKTLADIIEGCMIEKPAIHVYDMIIGDYEYLLHKLRIVTYGDEYKIGYACPNCDKTFETTAHLEELELKDFDEEKFESLRSFTLPKSGRRITLKFTTPHLLDDIEIKAKEAQRKYKDASIDFETKIRVTSSIDTIDGEVKGIVDLETIIDNLPAADFQKILNNIDNLNQCIGLRNELFITCPHCGEEIRTFFRFGPEFFRPSTL